MTDIVERLRLLVPSDPSGACIDAIKLIESQRAVLELYRNAVRIDVTMEGPKFMGANSTALKRAWDADLAALEGRT